MKALIVDDEAKAREMLAFLLETYVPEIQHTRLAVDAEQASDLLRSFQPELVFLDVKMPGRDGFGWLRSLPQRNFTVIFITAYNQYAIKAIRFSAFDYLLKPVDPLELRETIDRYLADQSNGDNPYDNLFYNTAQNDPSLYKLTIATTEGTHYLSPSEIVRCEADGNYTHFYLFDNRRVMASRPIGLFSELLDDHCFVRCHKSHLVNARYVARYAEQGLYMQDGSHIDISRRRRKEVKEKLKTCLQ